MKDASDPTHPSGEGDQLAELLACELELAQLLAETQQEARQLVEAARAESVRAEAEMDASLEREAESECLRIRQETQSSVREMSARVAARVAAFESVSRERVEQLAEAAFLRLVGEEDST